MMIEIATALEKLNDNDTKIAYQNLLLLEKISEESDILYQYFDRFLSMIDDARYVIRLRGYRLLCKQAKWDYHNLINLNINKILQTIADEKPTAVRQKITALQSLIQYKKELNQLIKQALLNINSFQYPDTLQPLIQKDIVSAVELIDHIL